MPALPSAMATQPSSYSKSNRRASVNPGQRIYPWLLLASTGLAATFCVMYITKPIVSGSQDKAISPAHLEQNTIPTAAPAPAVPKANLMPSQDRLPGEISTAARTNSKGASISPQSPAAGVFEQTNLRIQHILTAEAPGGQLAKIDLDVPVLYQSRHLRWTATEVAQARELLVRLADYQEKTQILKAEGTEILDSWNRLIATSIPAGELRADSPTLPANQQDSADAPRPAGLDTNELIKIQPAGK